MIRIQIVCDRCEAVGVSDEAPESWTCRETRSGLRLFGWLTGPLTGRRSLSGKDYCPKCKPWTLAKAKEGRDG